MNTLYVFEKQKLCHAQYLSELVKKLYAVKGINYVILIKVIGSEQKRN